MAKFNHEQIRGIVVPLVTPLNTDTTFDEKSTQNLVRHVVGKEPYYVHALFVNGMTGEFPYLDESVSKKMLDVTVDECRERIPVLFGASAKTLDETMELCEYGIEHGADALVIAPFYFWDSNREMPGQMKKITKTIKLPIYLYNNPVFALLGPREKERNIKTDIYKRIILENENIMGIKDSSGEIERFENYRAASIHKKSARAFIGDESKMRICPDSVPSFANLDPTSCKNLHNHILDFDCKNKAIIQSYINEVGEIVYCGKNKIRGGLKYALSILGICGETVLEPGQELLPEEKEKIKRFINKHY